MSSVDLPCALALEEAQRGSSSEHSVLRLLECFRSGRLPLQRLVDLALSENQENAELATWIAAELPSHIRTIYLPLLPCLDHPSHRVRRSMLDVLAHRAAAADDISIDETILAHVHDEHVAVRCRAVELMARWSNERLERVFRGVRAPEPDDRSSGTIQQRPKLTVLTDNERQELELLVAAVRSRNAFEEGAMRVARSKSEQMAATARALLSDSDATQE